MRSVRPRLLTQWRPRSHLCSQEFSHPDHVTINFRRQPRFLSISADTGPWRSKKPVIDSSPSFETTTNPTEITEDDRRRIYIRGSGNTATFYAFILRSRPDPPPVTLLVASNEVKAQFESDGKLSVLTSPLITSFFYPSCLFHISLTKPQNQNANRR